MVITQRRKRQEEKNPEKPEEKKRFEDEKKDEKQQKAPQTTKGRKIEKIGDAAVLPRILAAVILIAGFCYTRDYILSEYFMEPKEVGFASASVNYTRNFLSVKCSNDYEKKFKDCAPKKCGRAVMDGIVSPKEVKQLLEIAKKGMTHGGSAGGPTILDLHSGALTLGEKFVNIYALAKHEKLEIFSKEDFRVYRTVKNKIHEAIAKEFSLSRSKLFLTKPTFFSRIFPKPAKTEHDEYWHAHVDKITYGSFYYTSLLYLTDFNKDFTGGRFVFIDKTLNRTVEPKSGRLSFFTSGSENLHRVEKVTGGVRYAITVSFTCDKRHAISDPMAQ